MKATWSDEDTDSSRSESEKDELDELVQTLCLTVDEESSKLNSDFENLTVEH